jgi:hypothetical protein
LDDALSIIEIVPDFVPWLVGEKVTFIAQLAPGATVVPQVEFKLNGPLRVVEEMVSAVAPVFVRVTVCAELVVPTNWSGKRIGVVGEKLTTPVLSKVMSEFASESMVIRSVWWSLLKSPTAI